MQWKKYPYAVLALLLFIHILAHIDRSLLFGFSPQIIRDLGLTNVQYGLLAGVVWVLSYGSMALVMGSLADRHSRTRVIAVGILVWSLCTAASSLAQDFGQMVAARLLVASGEAALVPAAISLLIELFPPQQRSGAAGIFFMGIPIGLGLSFLIAGSVGAMHGWRDTFKLLGIVGIVVGLGLLLLRDNRTAPTAQPRGAPFPQQMHAVFSALRSNPAVVNTILGFVVMHMMVAGLSFVQLWLVRERGFEAAAIARTFGTAQIVFGTLGALVGGLLSDRLARRLWGGHAGFLVLLVAICGPLVVGFRLSAPGSALFYAGMCASCFMPLAIYGPANALIQGLTPPQLRSTTTGVTMLMLNFFGIAMGNVAIGGASDWLLASGSDSALTTTLLAADVLACMSIVFFTLAARNPMTLAVSAPATSQ